MKETAKLNLASDFEEILNALAKEHVRYVVVGGVAVVLQGSPRFTADLDLVVWLDPENARRAVTALAALGYRPRAPVLPEQFADASVRATWVREKNMTVFTLWSAQHPATEVDLFAEEPVPFEELWSRASTATIGEVSVRVASLEDLIAMKSTTGRQKDQQDIAVLKQLLTVRKNQGG
jgi:hypothetical protein